MLKGERTKIYGEALTKYGIKGQTLMLAEECAELVKACSKAVRIEDHEDVGFSNILDAMAEEIADVKVMIEQMQYYYGISEDRIELIMEEKLKRLKERMK